MKLRERLRGVLSRSRLVVMGELVAVAGIVRGIHEVNPAAAWIVGGVLGVVVCERVAR